MATMPKDMTMDVFLNGQQVKDLLNVGYHKALSIVEELNRELAAKGYRTIPKKVSRRYLLERYYLGVKK